MKLSRRHWLAAGVSSLIASAIPLSRLFARSEGGEVGRWGPLLPDPRGILDLPAGFSYVVLQRKGERMSDGYQVPGAFDGMACFETPGRTFTLMRNHELERVGLPGPYRPNQKPPAEAFDPRAFGGVTRLVVDSKTLGVVSSNLVLTGTVRNCAGGISPWGWLSCEETTEPGHGYVFLCPVEAVRVARAEPLPALGRFRHEAACFDPATGAIFLTEDRSDGALYRFVPDSREQPFVGKLEAMKIQGAHAMDTGVDRAVGDRFDVSWVEVPDPDPAEDTVRHQARQRGAAIVRRGEGLWYDSGSVWIASTSGGPASAGQIFRLHLGRDGKTDVLELAAQSESTRVLDMPDNLTVSPWGEVFLCEDSVGGDQYVRVLDLTGRVVDFARNAASQGELAGGCFSPDGGTFFVNLFADGLTLAVRGPFRPS
jgi:uncharacterized protein